jgi:hypothetical protein
MLSMWYTRKELALRMSLFYCGSISSNGWGSLIAAGILSRFHDWRMLFYIEGGITMAIGMAAIWILPGMPATARWLSEEVGNETRVTTPQSLTCSRIVSFSTSACKRAPGRRFRGTYRSGKAQKTP